MPVFLVQSAAHGYNRLGTNRDHRLRLLFYRGILNFFKKQNTLSFTLFLLSSCIVAITGFTHFGFSFYFHLIIFFGVCDFRKPYKRIGSFFMLFKVGRPYFYSLVGHLQCAYSDCKSQRGDLVRTTLYEVESPYRLCLVASETH